MLLVLCLLLSLAACAGKQERTTEPAAPDSTAEPTPAPTPEPTPEPLDGKKLFGDAADTLSQAQSLSADYVFRQEITIPDYTGKELGSMTLKEENTRSVEYEALGSDDFRARLTDKIKLGDSPEQSQQQVFADGVLYLEFDGARYYSKTEAADFLADQIPTVLLDETLYETVEAEETETGYTIRFSDAAGAESWAMPDAGEWIEASGSAELSADGALTGASYLLSYRFGGLTVQASWEAAYHSPETLDLASYVPENTKKYESLDSAAAPLMLKRAAYLLESAGAAQASMTGEYVVEAAAQSMRKYDQLSMLDRKSGFVFHEDVSVYATDYVRQQSADYSYEVDFAKGVWTAVFPDGTTESNIINAAEAREQLRESLSRYIPGGGELIDADLEEVGDYWLIRFAADEDYGTRVKNGICNELFPTDPKILDRLSSDYKTKAAEGYLAVEKVSGIPTAISLSFSGIHTIEDTPCALSMEMSMGLSLYTEDACQDILDDPLSGPEPENKPTPVFYQVSDADGHSMYLFGTIHVGDDRTGWLPQVIYDALDASDALAVEFDTDSFADSLDDEELRQELLDAYYYLDGTAIQNHVDSELYKEALLQLQVSGSYSSTSESMKPYLWSNAIEQFYLSQGRSFSSEKGVDSRLLRLARESEKEILDVESGVFQVRMLGGYSDPVQEMLLAGTVETSREEYLSSIAKLYEAWCTGDEAALIERLAAMSEEERAELDEDEQQIYDEYHQKMETERNANMVLVAEDYLSSGKTVFFAVGLAHLLGEGGLVHALRDAGYTVTLIDVH